MKKNNNIFRNGLFYLIVFIVIIGIISLVSGDSSGDNMNNISSSEFVQQLEEDKVENFTVQPEGGVYKVEGRYTEPQTVDTGENNIAVFGDTEESATVFTTSLLQNDPQLDDIYTIAQENGIDVSSYPQEQTSIWLSLLVSILPFIIFIGFLYMLMNQSGQGGQGGAGGGRNPMSFGRSTAKQADPSKSKVRFTDVAGLKEEKTELVEVVDFLKDPSRFTEMGARIPAGVLLTGPPGTGKTLLAKAVAGEAGVPFYSISGSEFVEMFVGVGASRVRDMFTEAKKNAPAIIFIDEIDAVGRKRGASYGGGNDEREQTLNQLLVELDGFTGNEGVIVIAATNRSDVLDPALLRPGRFDRQIQIGMPDVRERESILKVHAENKPLSKDVDLYQVAKTTPGFSGADLENLLNEAALVAARRKDTVITPYDVDEASDRVIAGPAKTERKFSERERRMVAFHEAGHTVTGLVLNEARIVHKVTIVPRGKAGGYAIMLPREDQFLYTQKDLFEQLVGLLGGRAAEEQFFQTQTSGASNDFQQATNIARAMVTQYGMSEKLGPVQYEDQNEAQKMRTSYSPESAFLIDEEVKRILNEAHDKAVSIVSEYDEQLTIIAEKLLEIETLNAEEIKSLFETGEMPEKNDKEEFPSEAEHVDDDDDNENKASGASYEEIKERTVEVETKKEDEFSQKNDLTDEEEGIEADESDANDPHSSKNNEKNDDDDENKRNSHIQQDRD